MVEIMSERDSESRCWNFSQGDASFSAGCFPLGPLGPFPLPSRLPGRGSPSAVLRQLRALGGGDGTRAQTAQGLVRSPQAA